MAKTESIDFKLFMSGQYKKEEEVTKLNIELVTVTALCTVAGVYAISPDVVEAATTAETFSRVKDAVETIAEYLAYGVIVFSGSSWMFGNRGKAIELMIGVSVGLLIVLHADTIVEWLKAIAGRG